MAIVEADNIVPEEQPESEVSLQTGTYEIIRNRLARYGEDLQLRLAQLNEARKNVFGSIETSLVATERITTEHNCVPRDIVSIGSRLLFGYNVHFGLKTERDLADVFSIYEFREKSFHEQPLELIRDEHFERDFQEVYRYYKDAVFARFMRKGPFLYMVFRIGKNASDIKAFKWSVNRDTLTYVDGRSEHEVGYPPQHEFTWIRARRDHYVFGDFPHVSIEDRVFVETVGGDLTVKVENNTDTGAGVYVEPVENADQTLDDAEISYAVVGNLILLKIRPYQEQNYRYIVFNEKLQTACRMDGIAQACILLPSDHGIIFPGGYYLQTGDRKTFDGSLKDMLFDRRLDAPNGEDFLYIFYNRLSGTYVLMRYNLIEQSVDTPIVCHGQSFFEAGELICFKAHEEPQKHHAVQVWQTPYVGEDYVPSTNTDSYLYKIGNREIVRGMAECHEVLGLIQKEDTYLNLYVDLVKRCSDIVDSYFWLDRDETFHLRDVLNQIHSAASAAVEEYEKVVRAKHAAEGQTKTVRDRVKQITDAIHHRRFEEISDYVASLAELRAVRGEVISLREIRYVDNVLVDKLEVEVAQHSESLSHKCVDFLLQPASLVPYDKQIEQKRGHVEKTKTVREAQDLEGEIAKSAGELEMLIEVVGNLKIEDATARTAIVDRISEIFTKINQIRTTLKKRIRDLFAVEGVAEFNSQLKLLSQSVINYLDICDTPEKCEHYLTKMMVQIEELEGRFAEFDEFIVQLSDKRDEIYNAFEGRKVALVEKRNKRANALMSAADRVLKGVKSRVDVLESIAEINGYFASDLMIEKVRDIVRELTELDDSVKVDDIQSRLKTTKEDAIRQLKDRQELFVDGANVIRMGQHVFSVNVQALDLTTVVRDGTMSLHLTGTKFFEPVSDPRLLATKDVWDQDVISENKDVYRAEYLAYLMFRSIVEGREPPLDSVRNYNEEQLINYVRQYMGPRYSEGYVKGVHDHDAARILRRLAEMHCSIGLLRFDTRARAMANLFWHRFVDKSTKNQLTARLRGVSSVVRFFPGTEVQQQHRHELAQLLSGFVAAAPMFSEEFVEEASDYLLHQIMQGEPFCVSQDAFQLHEEFHSYLGSHDCAKDFEESGRGLQRDPIGHWLLMRDWCEAFLEQRERAEDRDCADELAVLLWRGRVEQQAVIEASVRVSIPEMSGNHRSIAQDKYDLHYNHFLQKLERYCRETVPKYQQYVELKKEIVESAREELGLEEFRPRVLTSFVRNRLIDTVYLPLIGANFAKQIGTAGEQKRTDRMGLLLLISPPGYGKTTLMEYIANRLGIIFMKINGPTIGHQVTSLDPAEAPNAGAREEMQKLNLALEMGDNVMIYVDDIQHCNSEFLQKFISLCDAQRKIEGTYKGKSRTYDFRGRKVAVVMAGNPYTESGQKFQIPDMLSNRADVYNLGEIIGDSAEAFELSYLENCMTSNPVLNSLGQRSRHDVVSIIQLAEHGQREGLELEGDFSPDELNEYVSTIRKLLRVRDVVLKVNREYIRSAAQSDDYRTEPPFKLQGSYRNMNRIAERVVPVMNDQELEGLILSSYENDAQTLTTDTEANLLKLKELLGTISEKEKSRWHEIKKTFQKNLKLRGLGDNNQAAQVVAQMQSFSDGLDAIHAAIAEGVRHLADDSDHGIEPVFHAQLLGHIDQIREVIGTFGSSLEANVNQLHSLLAGCSEASSYKSSIPALDELAGSFKELAGQIRELAASHQTLASGPTSQKITVINKLPTSVANVIQRQFELLESWTQPLGQTGEAATKDLDALRNSVEACLASYRDLIARLDLPASRNEEGS